MSTAIAKRHDRPLAHWRALLNATIYAVAPAVRAGAYSPLRKHGAGCSANGSRSGLTAARDDGGIGPALRKSLHWRRAGVSGHEPSVNPPPLINTPSQRGLPNLWS